jgi:FkbM family methyltransferase
MTLRSLLKKWLYSQCPGFAGSFPYCGTKVYFPPNSHIFERVMDEGSFEKENTRLISRLIRPNSVYFDVGANIGLMSIPILYKHPLCKVVSFEPSPNTLHYLKQTVKDSHFGDRWLTIDKAVGRCAGDLDFCIADPGLGVFDGFVDTKRANKFLTAGQKQSTRKITVPVTTLDIEWLAMSKPSVSVIKIDVEGADYQVLEGAVNCIENEKPFIFLEWCIENLSAYSYSPEILLIFANRFNYRIFSSPYLVPVVDIDTLRLQMCGTETFILVPITFNSNADLRF